MKPRRWNGGEWVPRPDHTDEHPLLDVEADMRAVVNDLSAPTSAKDAAIRWFSGQLRDKPIRRAPQLAQTRDTAAPKPRVTYVIVDKGPK